MLKALIINTLLILHPGHLTMLSIVQPQGSDSLKVSFRMYYGDFLKDYKLYNPDFSIEQISGDMAVPNDLINKYFDDRVHIYINNRLLAGKLLSATRDDYDICLILFYRSDKKPEKFKIKNQVLIKLYNDQLNLIDININKYQDAFRLTPQHNQEKCKLN
jgi:hypothetical protein